MNKTLVTWGKPVIKTGKSGANGIMGTNLAELGEIKLDSTTIDMAEGEINKLVAEGGKVIAQDESEGAITLTFTVMSPSLDQLAAIYNGEIPAGEAGKGRSLGINSFVIADDQSFEVTPKTGIGVRIPKAHMSGVIKFNAKEGLTLVVKATVLEPSAENTSKLEFFEVKPFTAAQQG